MPVQEGLIASTAPVLVKFLLDQIKNYRISGKKTKDIEDLKKALEPFKDKFDINEEDYHKINENAEKLNDKLKENGFNITNEMYQKWTLNFLHEKLGSMKPPKSTFKTELWTAIKTKELVRDIKIVPEKYRIGDKIVVYFRSDRDCYLTLLNIGTSGELTVLFPNYLFQNNFTRADRIYAIPGDEYPFEYKLSGPPGIEKIKAIATTSRQNLLDFEFSKEKVFYSVERGIAARDISIAAKKMEEVSGDTWAEAICEFEVE